MTIACRARVLALFASLLLAASSVQAADNIFDFTNIPEVDLNPRPTPPPAPSPAAPDKVAQTQPAKPPAESPSNVDKPPARPAPRPAAPAIDFTKMRAKVPDAAAIAGATKTVHTTLADKFAAAKTLFDHRLLANELYSLASSEQPPERYVLLVEAFHESLITADSEMADQAWKNLSDAFEVPPSLRVDLLTETGKTASPELATSVAMQFLRLARAVKVDQLDTATPLLTAAEGAAARSQQKWFENRIRIATSEIRQRQTEAAQVKVALATLEKKPDDPAANTAVGKFYGLTCGEWDRALPFLVKASEPALKSAAELDLKLPDSADDQLALADAWAKLTERQTGPALRNIAGRALYWYTKSQASISGLGKIRVTTSIARMTLLTHENYASAGGGLVARFTANRGAVYVGPGQWDWGFGGVAFSSDERYVASSGQGVCKIWDLAELHLDSEIGGNGVAFAPKLRRLLLRASASPPSSDGSANSNAWIVYDYQARKGIASFSGTWYFCPTFSPDGRRIVMANYDVMQVADAATGQCLARQETTANQHLIEVAFSEDGASMATLLGQLSRNDHVVVWETDTLRKIATGQPSPDAPIRAIHFQGKRLLGLVIERGMPDGRDSFGIRDLGSNQPVCSFRTPLKSWGRRCFSPDGKVIALTEDLESGVIVCDTSTGAEITRFVVPSKLALSAATMPRTSGGGSMTEVNSVEYLAFSASGKYLATTSSDGVVNVFSVPRR